MASIMTAIQLQDNFSGVLYDVVSSVNLAIRSMSEMQQAVGADIDTSSLNGAQESIDRVTMSLNRMNSAMGNGVTENIRSSEDGQRRFNQEISTGVSHADSLARKIGMVAGTYLSMQTVEGILDTSDSLTQTTSRIDLMREKFGETDKTAQDLMNNVYASAQNARSSFDGMADVVARFGNNAKDAFSGTDEVIGFANLIQKQMVIAGASTQEASNAMLQLSQAMGSGVLRGDELNSIFEQAPNLIQNIADYMGVPIGKIREMASDGQISADIVKQAIFSASDEINAKFEQMPMTFGQIWQMFKNSALMAFQPVLEQLNTMANSEQFQSFVDGAINMDAYAAGAVLDVFNTVGQIGSFIADNWSVISPIIYAVVAALLAYAAISAVVAVINGIVAASTEVKSAAEMMSTGATFAATAAQYGLNAALAACPIAWIILSLVALVAVIIAVCSYIAKTSDVATSAFGVMTGGINVVIQFFKNLGLTVANIALGIWNAMGTCATNIGIAFRNAIRGVMSWFYSLLSTALNVISKICNALNQLPFISFDFSGITSMAKDYAAKSARESGSMEEFESISDSFNKGMSTFEAFGEGWTSDAFKSGAAWGDGVASKVSDKISSFTDLLSGQSALDSIPDYASGGATQSAAYVPQAVSPATSGGSGGSSAADKLADAANGINDIAANTGSTAADTARIADTIDITDEDLKYLRDIAERDIIDRTVFTKVEVNMGGITNEVHGMTDLNEIADGINTILQEQICIGSEG